MATPQPAGGPSPQVLQWLHRVIAPEYQDPQRTYSDVATTLGALPTLSPRTSVYTHENGKSELLVHLFGTLPVIFRGAPYNIPISIYVPHQYPRQPPIAFVTPAKDMMIRPGNHVDLAGKCYHPYLANWVNYADRSNIVDLCDVLRGVFGREPPVMAKQFVPTPPPNEPVAPPPRPPLPPELTPRSPSPAVTSPPQAPPPLPPLPREFAERQNGPISDPRRHSMAPPLPAYPNHQHHPQPQQYHVRQQPTPPPRPSGDGNIPPQYGPGPASPMQYRVPPPGSPGTHPVPVYPGAAFPQQQQQNYHQTGPPPLPQKAQSPAPPHQQHPQTPRPLSYQEYPPPQPQPQLQPQPQQQQQQQQPPQQQLPQQQPYQQPAAPAPLPKPPMDLLDSPAPPLAISPSASDTPAPPPPPNPEKDYLISCIASNLHTLAATTHSQTASALTGAAAQHSALCAAFANLEREAHELRHIAAVCDSDSEILRERIAMAEGVIQECRTRELPDVDSMVVAGSVVETQLYDLVAEDQAIEDTIYVLGKALDKERIPLDVFLKVGDGLVCPVS
ncbi:UEV-domain-containing protein [Wilcoxina mikolae CBS 423.85]|nr:UEV-domain-containing protein [Wilcoxina mikolae CBS 423.85]